MKNRLAVTNYGKNGNDKGISILDGNSIQMFIPLNGKCNFCIERKDRLYASVAEKENFIYEYKIDDNSFEMMGKYPMTCFYSYGQIIENRLFLASFSDGADAIYDLDEHREIDVYLHQSEGKSSRSHYIGITPDKKHIYSVDNGLQRIYLYQFNLNHLILEDVLDFPEENIRLMSYSPYSGFYYLNTEITNAIYTLEYKNDRFHIINRILLPDSQGCFSGANAINETGDQICVSLRGKDRILYYQIHQNGSLELLDDKKCGKIPRDAIFVKDQLYLSCSGEDQIEVYNVEKEHLKKTESIFLTEPITFGLN